MLNIKATTLSVLMSPNSSIQCGLEISGKNDMMEKNVEEYINLTLRFDGDKARLAGFPSQWTIHEEIEDEDSEVPVEIEIFISREEEKEILSQLKNSLKKQFEDDMFKDDLNESEKELALSKIDEAIKSL